MKLTNPTDAELDIAFAEHIAGWTDLRLEEGEDVDIDAREIYPWAGTRGTVEGERHLVPAFTQHVSLLLPWLEKMTFWSSVYNSGKHIAANERYWVETFDGTREYEAYAATIARAAVLVLLLTKGVEVEVT